MTTETGTADSYDLVHVPEESTYEIRDGEKAAGVAHYVQGEGSVTFDHTVVLPEYGGQGLGGRLARFALDDAVAKGQRIVPVCPFIVAYVKKHPEYEEHLDWPAEQAH